MAWRDDVFSVEKRRALVEKGEHLLRVVGDANPLSEAGFGGTRASSSTLRVCVGDAYAFQHPAYAWLYEGVLRELLDERCDAFVFNILVVPPREGQKSHGRRRVARRPDAHAAVDAARADGLLRERGLPPSPGGFDGGEPVCGPGGATRHREGSVLVFRGDQSHRVKAFCLNNEGDCSVK